jgi:polysaccharide biosynthesis transport protein
MEETEFDLRSIFGLLRRQFRLILVTLIVVTGLAMLVAFALTPSFTASALLLVDPSSKNLLDPEAQANSAAADSARIDSEVELVRSDHVLLKVIEREGLTSDDEFGVSFGLGARLLAFLRVASPSLPTGAEALGQTLTQLRNAVSVQRRGLTYLISVQVRSEEPEKAARLANVITEAYISDQLDFKVASMLTARDALQARISGAREAIALSEGSFDSFITDNMQRIAEDTGRTDLLSMQKQAQELAAARAQSLQVSQELKESLTSGDISSVVARLQSDALNELEQQRQRLASDLTAATGTPTEINLRAELDAIEKRLATTAEREISSLEQTVAASQTQEENLRQSLRREVLDSSLSGDVLAQLYELQQNAEIARTQYQTLLARVQDVQAQADLQLADSRIVSPALAPQQPSFPNRLLIIGGAMVLALALGIGLAFVYEHFIGGFISEDQVAEVLRTPIAATIPRERTKSEKERLADLIVTSPLSVYSESIRRTRAAIQGALRNSPGKQPEKGLGRIIMVTSSVPNEGKTTIALSLARSYAMFGQSTLLIDCDLRKPSIHRHLEIQPSLGLLDYLSADPPSDDLNGIITTDGLTSVTLIVGSRRSDLPTDQLLAGPSFERLLKATTKAFDVIILDTPPVGPVVDGLFIAQFADVITFVTRWASTGQRDARHSIASLNASKNPDTPIVTVLNQQDDARTAYDRKYGGYYSYNT